VSATITFIALIIYIEDLASVRCIYTFNSWRYIHLHTVLRRRKNNSNIYSHSFNLLSRGRFNNTWTHDSVSGLFTQIQSWNTDKQGRTFHRVGTM